MKGLFLPEKEEPLGVLIANRGECATRIFNTCYTNGWQALVIYTKPEENSPRLDLVRRLGHRTVMLSGDDPVKCYLDGDQLIHIAKEHGASIIHPGWGFLSEDEDFARKARDASLIVVGINNQQALGKIANKVDFKEAMTAAGVPVLPGSRLLMSPDEALIWLHEHAGYPRNPFFPAYLKAAYGGGGIGTKLIQDEADLRRSFPQLRERALTNFSNGALFFERAVRRARHLEVQVVADKRNVVCLGVRDCSLQRNRQKIIEETPPPNIPKATLRHLYNYARRGAKALNILGVGTFEFLLDLDEKTLGNLYCIEMNKRLQVEHGVTEEAVKSLGIANFDLVALQIRLAHGERIPAPVVAVSDPVASVHVIELRVKAESVGEIVRASFPSEPNLRFDHDINPGTKVLPDFDPLLGKIIVWGQDRMEALRRARLALSGLRIDGVSTNMPLLRKIFENRDFQSGNVTTELVEEIEAGIPYSVQS